MQFTPISGSELEYDATTILARPTNSSLVAALCDLFSSCSGIHSSSSKCIPSSDVHATATGPGDEALSISVASVLPKPPSQLTLQIDANIFCLSIKGVEPKIVVSKYPPSTLTYTANLPSPPSGDAITGNTTDVPVSTPIYGIGVYITDLDSMSLKDSTFYADLRVYILKYYKSYTKETKDEVSHVTVLRSGGLAHCYLFHKPH